MEATLRLRYAALPSTSLRTARAGSTTVADRGHFRVRIPQKQPLLRQRTPAARQQLLQLLHQEHRARPPGHPQHTLPWRPFPSSVPAPDAHRRKAALQAPQRFPPHLLPRQRRSSSRTTDTSTSNHSSFRTSAAVVSFIAPQQNRIRAPGRPNRLLTTALCTIVKMKTVGGWQWTV